MIAPHAVVIDHRVRSTAIELYNPGTEPAEVVIETLFGYPITDSTGTFDLYIPEGGDTSAVSAAGWIQAFPRQLRLAPLQRQTVRLLGRPPVTLPDGEYWARLVVTARGGSIPVAGIADTSNLRVGLTLEVRTLLPIQYRKGNVTTGVSVGSITNQIEGDSLAFRPILRRTGSGAFLGTLRAALVDSVGDVVSTTSAPLAVYYDLVPRVTLPIAGIPPGRYRLQIDLASERKDLQPSTLLQITPVTADIEIRIP